MAKKSTGRAQEQPQSNTANGGMQNGSTSDDQRGGISPISSERDTSPSNDEIAARAYEIYEREGRSDGKAMDHWLQAESELRAERQKLGADFPQSRRELPRSARRHQEAQSPSI